MDSTQTAPNAPGPHVLGSSFRRSSTDRVLLGLCAGVARATNTSPLAIRLATIALGVLLFPLVLLAYIVTALILPRDDGSTLIGSGERNRRDVIVAIAISIVAAPAILGAAASHGLTSGHAWLPLLFFGAGAAVAVWFLGRDAEQLAAPSPADRAAHQAYAAYTPAGPAAPGTPAGTDPTAAIAAFGDPFSGQVTGPYPPDTIETVVHETAATELVDPAGEAGPDEDGHTLIQPAPAEQDDPTLHQAAAGAATAGPVPGGPTFVPPGSPPTAVDGGDGQEPPAKKKRASVALPVLALMATIPAVYAVLIAVGAVDANWESLSVMLAILALAAAGGAVAIALLRPSYLGAGLLVILAAFIGTSSIVVHQVGPYVSDGVGQRTYRPLSTDDLRPVYVQGIGQLDLDLRRLNLEPGTKTTVRARVGLGQIRIAVPEGVRVIAAPNSQVSDLTLTARENGAAKSESAAAPTIALDLTVKAGDTQLLSGNSRSLDRLEVLNDQDSGFWDDGNSNPTPAQLPATPQQPRSPVTP